MKVIEEPEPLDVHVIRPCASLNVVLPVLDWEADSETLPCESRKVVVFPDVLVVVEILRVPSLTIAFCFGRSVQKRERVPGTVEDGALEKKRTRPNRADIAMPG